jgi:hypothetical protein
VIWRRRDGARQEPYNAVVNPLDQVIILHVTVGSPVLLPPPEGPTLTPNGNGLDPGRRGILPQRPNEQDAALPSLFEEFLARAVPIDDPNAIFNMKKKVLKKSVKK